MKRLIDCEHLCEIADIIRIMCGIAGIIHSDTTQFSDDQLSGIFDALKLRGPDDSGVVRYPGCTMLHTRLAVIDLATNKQPMQSSDGCLSVVFNGEIYNHRALRSELSSMGYRFESDHADTEVLMHGYRAWGENITDHLNGMYAFGIYDQEDGSLFLARDAIGKKPLYYYHDPVTHQFRFASLPAALLGITNGKLNTQGMLHYLQFGYTENQTTLSRVKQLRPGGRCVVKRDRLQLLDDESSSVNVEGDLSSIESLLNTGVINRLEADVPLGCFLSGGIDSSIIAAMAQKQLGVSGERLRTFCASMPNDRYDESAYAERVAKHLGTEHKTLQISPEFEDDMLHLIQHIGQPFGDSSILPTYWLAKEMKKHVTVALSGDGGDELFFGYERYKGIELIAKYGALIKHLPMVFAGGAHPKSKGAKLKRLIAAARAGSPFDSYMHITNIFDQQALGELFPGLAGRSPSYEAYMQSLEESWSSREAMSYSSADCARMFDIEHYLPGDLLQKVDRASMAAGLEVRSPFLDKALVSLVKRYRFGDLCDKGNLKARLKMIAGKYLPADIVNRKKMGFAVPIGEWFCGKHRDVIQRWLLDCPALGELGCNKVVLEHMIHQHLHGVQDHTHRLFALLTLAMHLSLHAR